MSAGRELWALVEDTLNADAGVMALVDAVYDKVPSKPWKGRQAYISRGPVYGSPEDADCISAHDITIQIDIWSRQPDRWTMDEMVSAVCDALHERDFQLTSGALASLRVALWRVIDDPDPLTVHGVVQFSTIIENPEED